MVVIIWWQIRRSCYLVTKLHCRDLENHLTIVLLHGAQPSEIFCVRKSFLWENFCPTCREWGSRCWTCWWDPGPWTCGGRPAKMIVMGILRSWTFTWAPVPGVQGDAKHFWCFDVAVLQLFFSSSLTVVCPFNFRCFRGFSRIVIIVVCS